MKLHDAFVSLLVPAAMTSLYLERFPPHQLDTVDGEFRTRAGAGPTRQYGPETVAYHHLGLRFAARSEDVAAAHAEVAAARDILSQYPAGSYTFAGLEIGRIAIGGGPFFLGQDSRERVLVALFCEVWTVPQ